MGQLDEAAEDMTIESTPSSAWAPSCRSTRFLGAAASVVAEASDKQDIPHCDLCGSQAAQQRHPLSQGSSETGVATFARCLFCRA